MIELLKLCGYEANEIETELPRVKKVFDRLGIIVEDIERGKKRLAKYFDMNLVGVRKVFGLCMKDVINTVLAREEGKKKILYGFMSPGFEILGSAVATKSKEVYAAMLPMSFHFVLGQIFSKTVPILEAAEHLWVKAGKVSHCGNVKTLVGLLALDIIPKPDLLVTSGYLCDAAPKTVDIIQELYNIPTYCYTTCQDREFKQYPDAERIIKLSARSMRHLAAKMEEITGVEITDAMVWESYNSRDELRKALLNLQNLMETSDPLPISTTHEIFWAHLSALPVIIPEVGELASVLNTLYRELQSKVDTGEGVTQKGAPRIFSLLPTHYTNPRWEHAICEIGIAPVASETGCFPMHGKRSADLPLEKTKNPYEQLSRRLHHSMYQNTSGRSSLIVEACKRLRVDGVLARFHVGCRSVALDALSIKDAIAKELGIPVILVERDDFDPRVYNEEQYRRRIKLFKDVLNNSRQNQ